jgi:hypothetical protein
VSLSGSASGSVVVPGIATGSVSVIGSTSGTVVFPATGSGTIYVAGNAVGVVVYPAIGTGSLSLSGAAIGIAYEVAHPGTVTGGFITASVKGSWTSAPSVSIGQG